MMGDALKTNWNLIHSLPGLEYAIEQLQQQANLIRAEIQRSFGEPERELLLPEPEPVVAAQQVAGYVREEIPPATQPASPKRLESGAEKLDRRRKKRSLASRQALSKKLKERWEALTPRQRNIRLRKLREARAKNKKKAA